jgi:hypothetical protein
MRQLAHLYLNRTPPRWSQGATRALAEELRSTRRVLKCWKVKSFEIAADQIRDVDQIAIGDGWVNEQEMNHPTRSQMGHPPPFVAHLM